MALPSCSTLILFFSLVAQKDRDSTHSETPHFGLTFSAKDHEVKLEKIEIYNLFLIWRFPSDTAGSQDPSPSHTLLPTIPNVLCSHRRHQKRRRAAAASLKKKGKGGASKVEKGKSKFSLFLSFLCVKKGGRGCLHVPLFPRQGNRVK